ncbi:MAG: phage portal protein [Planctomycetes bacterium]|nr:phage portal protein [Planctomycetota bacterium]
MPRRSPINGSICSHMAELRGDYDAAKSRSNRFLRQRALPSGGAGADWHIRNQTHFLTMLELAREFERNEPLLRQAVRRLKSNVNVGGMALDPETGDKKVDRHLAQRWADWSGDRGRCHAADKYDFATIANIALARIVLDGDVFGLPLADGRLQMHEAHRCRTPDRARKDAGVCGVLSDELGRPVRYKFTKERVELGAPVRVNDVTEIPARDKAGRRQVFHLFHPERFSQSRGITAIAPVVNVVGMRDDLDFAQLVKAQVAACVTYFEKVELGAPEWSGDGSAEGELSFDEWPNGSDRSTVGMHPGKVLRGKPGHSWEGFSPNIPNSEYFQHVRLMLTYLAINLDLPLIVLLLDASEANFSSYRNVIDQARMTYHEIQRWFASQFHAEVYRWKVGQWLANDPELARFQSQALERGDPEALFRHFWNPIGYPYIEPVKDQTAHLLELANGMTSPRRFHAKRGQEFETVAVEIIEDRAFAIDAAVRRAHALNQALSVELGDEKVHWRDLCPTPTAEGIQITFGNESPGEGGSAGNSDTSAGSRQGASRAA